MQSFIAVHVLQYKKKGLFSFWQDHVYQITNIIPNRMWQKCYRSMSCDIFLQSCFPSCSAHHITASQFKSNLVSVITSELVNAMFVYHAYSPCYKSCLTSQNVIGIKRKPNDCVVFGTIIHKLGAQQYNARPQYKCDSDGLPTCAVWSHAQLKKTFM